MEAYQTGDREASKVKHAEKEPFHAERIGGSRIVDQCMLGLCMAPIYSYWVPYLSCIVATVISMEWTHYVSTRSRADYVELQYRREWWETENYLEGELQEMTDLYRIGYGLPEKEARPLLETMAKNKALFVDHMMTVELGLLPPRLCPPTSLAEQVVAAGGYILCSMLPASLGIGTAFGLGYLQSKWSYTNYRRTASTVALVGFGWACKIAIDGKDNTLSWSYT